MEVSDQSDGIDSERKQVAPVLRRVKAQAARVSDAYSTRRWIVTVTRLRWRSFASGARRWSV